MLTGAELVTFVYDIVHIMPESIEYNRELALLLLHVHKKAPERRNEEVFSRVVELGVHFALITETGLLSSLRGVNVIVFLVMILLFLVITLRGHSAVLSNAKLLSRSLRQRHRLKHLLQLVLELGSRATRPSELVNQLHPSLFDSRVIASILKFLLGVDHVDEVHVSGDVVGSVFSLRDVRKHRGVLWLGEGQLVVCQIPKRFSLSLGSCLHLLARQLTPCALSNDTTDAVCEVQSLGPIRH